MRKYWALFAIIAIAAALIWGWRANRTQEQAELQLGLDSSRVLEQQFAKARAIKVAAIQGRIVAKSSDTGLWGVLQSSQTKIVPFTVDYFVDLSKVDNSDFRWDEEKRTLIVQVPDVAIGRPNIDEASADTSQSGIFISRDAALRLNQSATKAVKARANVFAKEPKNMEQARTSAREAIREFAQLPLQAAGKKGVQVIVKFPFEGGEKLDRWDESRPIEEIIRDKR